jgi:hypothetical protein
MKLEKLVATDATNIEVDVTTTINGWMDVILVQCLGLLIWILI